MQTAFVTLSLPADKLEAFKEFLAQKMPEAKVLNETLRPTYNVGEGKSSIEHGVSG